MTKRIRNNLELCSHGSIEARKILVDILDSGLVAANPYYNAKALIEYNGEYVLFHGKDFMAEGDPNPEIAKYPITKQSRIFLFAIGKGIQNIARAIEETLGERLDYSLVIAKHGDPIIMKRAEVILAGHPTPDENCIKGSKKLLNIIQTANFTKEDLVITVIGNGVSSLLTYPSEGVSLNDVVTMVKLLQIEYGLPTAELNHIRNNIDVLKGGRISRYLKNARTVHIISVPPTVNDTTTIKGYNALMDANYWLHTLPCMTNPRTAIEILKTRQLDTVIPLSIQKTLNDGLLDNGISRKEFEESGQRVFALLPEKRDATAAAFKRAKELGLNAYILTRKTQSEASATGKFFAQMAKNALLNETVFKRPCALIISGELLVTCGKTDGIGGRNQEFVLAGASVIAGLDNIAIGGVDTDGTDGPGGFISQEAHDKGIDVISGGIIDGFTNKEAKEKGLSIQKALIEHDTSRILWELNNAVIATQNISIGDLECCVIL